MWKYKFSKVFNKVNTTIAAIRDFGRLVFTHVCTCLFFCVFNLLQVSVKEKLPKNDPTSWVLLRPLRNIHRLQKYNWLPLPLNRFSVCPFPCGQKMSGESFRRCTKGEISRGECCMLGSDDTAWSPKKICSQQVGCTTLWDPQHDHWKLLMSGSVENSWKNHIQMMEI